MKIDPIIRRRQLREIVGLSPGRCYELLRLGRFPKPIKLSPGRNGAVGWRLSALNAWLISREAESDTAA